MFFKVGIQVLVQWWDKNKEKYYSHAEYAKYNIPVRAKCNIPEFTKYNMIYLYM